MATIEIAPWLAMVDFDSDDEIYALYKTVEEQSPHGHFGWAEQNVRSGKRCYVTAPNITDSLLLVSDAAIAEFLRLLEISL